MSIFLYNTLSRQKEEFKPRDSGFVGIYLCGPTVYSDPHLGNARTAVAFDVIRRWFIYRGFKVRFVSNVTDVGHITESLEDEGRDRISERARLERIEPIEIADRYFWRYFTDMGRLNVLKPDITPRATGHIIEQIQMIEELLERGLAYETDGSVYFRVANWKRYGELSNRKIDEMISGTREEIRGEKEDPRDFALWKKAEPEHIQRWPSPWGDGFPGWHIECSAMSLKYLGDGFDIHGGGLDLSFPHHEAEIAQAEGSGHEFARYWLHSNMLTINGEKMSKSKGNFITLHEFLEKNPSQVLRFLLVSSHYRSISEVSEESLKAAESGFARLQELKRELKRRLDKAETLEEEKRNYEETMDDDFNTPLNTPLTHYSSLKNRIEQAQKDFEQAMDDDFNTPEALAALFLLVRDLNSELNNMSKELIEQSLNLLTNLTENVFGLSEEKPANDEKLIDTLAQIAIEARQNYRLNRDFKKSDELRDRLKEAGIQLEDTNNGTRWKIE